MQPDTFFPGDKIVEQIGDHLIVDNNGVIEVVKPERGTRFIIDLDDSKCGGPRRSLGMTYDEQINAAKRYIELFQELK